MPNDSPIDDKLVAQLRQVAKDSAVTMSALRRAWLDEPDSISVLLPALLEAQARRAIENDGDYLGAHDLAMEGLRLASAANYPTQELELARATALARSGSPIKARATLEKLVASAGAHATTYAATARTFRDVAQACTHPADKQQLFRDAAAWSERGLSESDAPVSLANHINRAYLAGQVAQFSKLGGDETRSRECRAEVLRCCEAAETLGAGPDERFWIETNRAEVALLEGDLDTAASHYLSMVHLGREKQSSITANSAVCRMLLTSLELEADSLDHCFPLAPVVVFSGHMFDLADRKSARFPTPLAAEVKVRIAKLLDEKDVIEGLSSASAGADLLFGEALIERGGRLRLVLPFSIDETRRICVEPFGQEWTDRYDRLISKAVETSVVESGSTQGMESAPGHFQYSNHLLAGFAWLTAKRAGLPLQPLVVWDGADSKNPIPGGTGDFVQMVEALGIPPWIIPPTLSTAPPEEEDDRSSSWTPITDLDGNRKVRTFLFADVKGFSKLPDTELRHFATRFLEESAAILHAPDSGVILCNTWGDALYAVFDSVEKAAATALKLRDQTGGKATDNASDSPRFNLRISLHAGPVHVAYDPVIRNEAYIGGHVVQTARMEPIAEVGQVLSSAELAALVSTSPSRDRFAFHYLGLARLPKGYGRLASYELDWKERPE